jgi:outer membrane lipoprotein-sorting protein
MINIVQAVFIFAIMAMNVSASQEKIVPVRWINEAEMKLAQIDNYTSFFHKQERVKGKLKEEEVVLLKFKKPFKIYMKWVKDPGKGREVLYVEGWNHNKIKVHEVWMKTGFTLDLDATGFLAMRGSRHSITESGLENFLRVLGRDLYSGIQFGEFTCRELGEEMVYGCQSQIVEYLFPKDKTKGYYCHRAVINIDVGTKIPIRVRIYDWEGDLVEDYGYESLKLNAGLTDADFAMENPEYKFSSSRTKAPPFKNPQE